jgi:hypothetical protein
MIIPSWLRVLTVLTVLTPWIVGVMYSILILHQLPDVAWMGVPALVITAVAPGWSLPNWRGTNPREDPAEQQNETPEPGPPRHARPSPPWDPDQDDWSRWGT